MTENDVVLKAELQDLQRSRDRSLCTSTFNELKTLSWMPVSSMLCIFPGSTSDRSRIDRKLNMRSGVTRASGSRGITAMLHHIQHVSMLGYGLV